MEGSSVQEQEKRESINPLQQLQQYQDMERARASYSMSSHFNGQPTLLPSDGGGSVWMPGGQMMSYDPQLYQMQYLNTPTATSSMPSTVAMGGMMMQSQQQIAEEACRKREHRLLQNREAAKECRRRKKEYVKCLETRAAMLENQNRQLIEELKALKEIYVYSKVG